MFEDKEKLDGDIIITIPVTTSLEVYKKEIAKAEEEGEIMNYKVVNFPTKSAVGKKCWVCYDKRIIGYMTISGFSEKAFTCSTTGKQMQGKFIERSGKFHWLKEPFEHEGFRGFRYVTDKFKRLITY